MSDLRGKVAIVTGATGGIGNAISRALDAVGARLIVHSRSNPEDGQRLTDSLTEAGYVCADLSVDTASALLVEQAIDRWGRLDIVVNCAGTTRLIDHADLDLVSTDLWREILDINLLAPWHLTRAAAPYLRAQPETSGCIINISSVAGIRPLGSSLPYAVSKAALNHMTVLLAKALGPKIRVNAVAPGVIETPWTAGFDAHRAFVREHTPLREIGQPDDVATAVLYLASADYVTGEVTIVDGGLSVTS